MLLVLLFEFNLSFTFLLIQHFIQLQLVTSSKCPDDDLTQSIDVSINRPIGTINSNYTNITIGFLSSFARYGLGNKISGAIPLAVEEINR